MIDIDELDRLAKAVAAGPSAQQSADPVIRNMGRLEYAEAKATSPAAILALIAEVRMLRDVQAANVEIKAALLAEVRALREDAERWRWAITLEDNIEAVYAAVISCGPKARESINIEVDHARATEKSC